MKHIDRSEEDSKWVVRSHLRADCESCFGLCCAALYFSASEGFPENKEAGSPCRNLQADFRCSIHQNLVEKGCKGCTVYDCFGAGQQVARITYKGVDWRQSPVDAQKMFQVFLVMHQLHEMLWYLTESLALPTAEPIYAPLSSMLEETEHLTELGAEDLLILDVAAHRAKVNPLLQKVSELVRSEYRNGQSNDSGRRKRLGRGADLIGADLRKTDLRGENLRGAYLIAADLRGVDLSGTDLIGADLRDADLSGADLSKAIFLTQGQINAAKGDGDTKLPPSIIRPQHFCM